MDPATLAALASTIGSVISIGSARNAERRADRYRRLALQLQRDRVNLTRDRVESYRLDVGLIL